MNKLRRIHLDFHTSPCIENIGARFNKTEFSNTLKKAHVNAITLFAKCHHGMFYYKDTKFCVHPHLSVDLLPLQLEACREADIETYIYVSAGLDQNIAYEHPEYIVCDSMTEYMKEDKFFAGYNLLCFNSGYLNILCAQLEEVVKTFMPTGIFLDIVGEQTCYCSACQKSMAEEGLYYDSESDVKKHKRKVLSSYYKRVNELLKKLKPDISILHNSGNFPKGRYDIMGNSTHFEIESLPTAMWGYDHFPASISYLRNKGKISIGMTGKFHENWGDFGGFKYPDALLFEAAQAFSFGAGISVGDQLHPSGKIDKYTYENIGNSYCYYESLESNFGGTYIADVAVLSQAPEPGHFLHKGEAGAIRILLEEKILFDSIDENEISNKYKLIILPDSLTINKDLSVKLKNYVGKGGKILVSGDLISHLNSFDFDLGASYIGLDTYRPTYFRANYNLKYLKGESLAMHGQSYDILCTGKELAEKISPYFNRDREHFSSHFHTPCDYDKPYKTAITEGKNGIYIASDIFTEYVDRGAMNPKLLVVPLIDKLLGERKITTNLPSQAKITFLKHNDRYILHILFANTIKRGRGIEVIEDIVPLHDVKIAIKIDELVKEIKLFPQNENIEFERTCCQISFTLNKFRIHQAIEILL